MATIRVNKTGNYTVMSNYHLKEKNMSLKAKGLLSVMLSLPDDWDYSIAGLVAICKENETAVKTALKELQKFGYLKVTKLMPDKSKSRARIEYVYDVFEKPEQEHKKQDIENLYLENLHVENQGQLNTKELSTKKLNTNNTKHKESKGAEKPKKENQKSFDELIDNYTANEKLREELKEHLKTRKSKKASLTNRAIELSFKELDKLANTDEEKIEIVQQSIMYGWTGFFELRKNNKPQKENKTSYSAEEYERMIMSRYIDNDNETPKTQETKNKFNLDEFEKYLTDKYKK